MFSSSSPFMRIVQIYCCTLWDTKMLYASFFTHLVKVLKLCKQTLMPTPSGVCLCLSSNHTLEKLQASFFKLGGWFVSTYQPLRETNVQSVLLHMCVFPTNKMHCWRIKLSTWGEGDSGWSHKLPTKDRANTSPAHPLTAWTITSNWQPGRKPTANDIELCRTYI